jgi:oligosaccharide translocation protein RFT1
MVAFTMIYIFATISLYRLGLGDTSLVYANILNLSARTSYCLHFVSTYFANQRSQNYAFHCLDALPSWTLCITCTLSAVLSHLSKKQFDAERLAVELGRSAILNKSVLLHIGIGVALSITCLWAWWRSSGRYLDISMRRDKKES